MKEGLSFGMDCAGNVFGARFMGAADQCLRIKLPLTENPRWCVRSWPHDGDCDYSGGQGEPE